MPRDFLKDAKDGCDVIVIGSGLAGLTAANVSRGPASTASPWRAGIA
jgi:hypothetical protein